MRKKTTFLFPAYSFALLASIVLAGPVAAAPGDRQPSVTVTGTGEVFERPDMARVNIGVVTQREAASESLRQNSAAVEKVLATLKNHNIADDDIQTSNFNIGPQYDYGRSGEPPRLIGYRVTNEVRVAVRQLDDLGKLLDEVVSAGSNHINGVQFDIADAAALEDTARRAAVKDARRKADLYAQEAGVELGKVMRIEEISGPVAMPQVAFGVAEQARAVPVAPGRQAIRQTVRVTFAIDTGQ